MTFSNDTQLTDVTRIARHLVLATLLAAPIPSYAALQAPKRPASTEAAQSSPISRQVAHRRSNHTYLAMVGPSALNFADTELALPPEPVMPEPPKPNPNPAKTTPANHNAAPTSASATLKPAVETPDLNPQPDNVDGPKPVSILPDDTRREIRPEDVLPYFQFPGSTDSGAVIINPAPAAAPPSTATYRQQ